MKKNSIIAIISLCIIYLLGTLACSKEEELLLAEEGEELSGGQVTVFDKSPNAFGLQAPGLEGMDELLFFVGNSFFNQNWVTAPASTTARDGLGPLFNARSCSSCHFKDGRGRPPMSPGEKSTGLLLRLHIPEKDEFGTPLPEPTYGGQLQDRSILSVEAEGEIDITYEEIPGQFADGETYSLRKPTYRIKNLAYGDLASDVLISPRVANHMSGLGLLEAIPEETILALADPNDQDGDGISGKPNRVYDVEKEGFSLGRFGWKANQPSLVQQSAAAFIGDIGITSFLFPSESCSAVQSDCQNAPNGDDGLNEIEADDLEKVTLYVSSLAVPARRDWEDQTVLRGKNLFIEVGCAKCHIPKLQTGSASRKAFENQTIRPYTDLLLHDMGEGLADFSPEYEASGTEWRTPPLWGIGLVETVNDHTNFLHDGRARNLMEAVLWHGGEAENAKQAVLQMTKTERSALLSFLESL